jgi:hypothetical protein
MQCALMGWLAWSSEPATAAIIRILHAPCATEDDEAPGRYSLPHPREELGVIALEPIELRGLSDHKLVVGILGEVRELARP